MNDNDEYWMIEKKKAAFASILNAEAAYRKGMLAAGAEEGVMFRIHTELYNGEELVCCITYETGVRDENIHNNN